jgi:hypothetical protein
MSGSTEFLAVRSARLRWSCPYVRVYRQKGESNATYLEERVFGMLVVHVHVKAECAEAFRKASLENASRSVKEPGIARSDVNDEMLQMLSRAL